MKDFNVRFQRAFLSLLLTLAFEAMRSKLEIA